MIDDVVQALRSCRLRFGDEKDLQGGIERVFKDRGFLFEREVELEGSGRIDFVVLGRDGIDLPGTAVGVEVKIKGSTSEVTRQLHRYAVTKRLSGLVLATTMMRHATQIRLGSLAGCEFRSVYLVGSAL